MDIELIPEATLAGLWRIHPNTPYTWRLKKLIAPEATVGGTVFYSPATIDAFHARIGHHFAEIPPVLTLLAANQPVLLLAEEVASLLDCSSTRVWYRAIAGQLAYFTLGKVFRYWAPSVQMYLANQLGDTVVRAATAGRVLCVSPQTIRRLVKSGLLESVLNPKQPNHLFVSRTSLMALLAQQVRGMTAEEWWEMILLEPKPPMTKQQVSRLLHIAYKTITPKVARGEIACIVTPGGRTLFPSRGLEQLMALGYAPIIKLLTNKERIASGKLCGHSECSQLCLTNYIDQHRTTEFSSTMWLALCQGNAPIMALSALPSFVVGLSADGAMEAVDSGALRGVYLEDGEVAILSADAIGFRRRWERQHSVYYQYHS